MESKYNDFTQEETLNSIRSKNNMKTTNKHMLISPKANKNINNTDVVVWINDHHKALDAEHETGIKIDHLGKKTVFHIDHIAHKNKSLIYFKGHTESDKIVHFVKPVSDLKIQLTTLKRKSSNLQKTPFGFADWDDYEDEKYRCTLE